MKAIALVLAIVLSFAIGCTFARGEELKLANGSVLKNVEVRSFAPDGVVIKYNGQVTKLWWNYFTPAERARLESIKKSGDAAEAQSKAIEAAAIMATFDPFIFDEKETKGWVQAFEKTPTGTFENQGLNRVPQYRWTPVGDRVFGILDEALPKSVGANQKQIMSLYPIGHSDDSSRDPRFTQNLDRAKQYYATQGAAATNTAKQE